MCLSLERVVNHVALTSNYTPLESLVTTESTCCSGLNQHQGYENQCEFLNANPQCTEHVFLLLELLLPYVSIIFKLCCQGLSIICIRYYICMLGENLKAKDKVIIFQ